MHIGTKIKKIRELFDYDQKYVAKQLGIHQSTVSRMEKTKHKEKIPPETLEKLANLYNVEPEDILNFDDKFFVNIQEQKGKQSGGIVINKISEEFLVIQEARLKALETTIEAQSMTIKIQEARIRAQEEELASLKGELDKRS